MKSLTVKKVLELLNPNTKVRILNMADDSHKLMFKGYCNSVPEVLYTQQLVNVNGNYVHFSEHDQEIGFSLCVYMRGRVNEPQAF